MADSFTPSAQYPKMAIAVGLIDTFGAVDVIAFGWYTPLGIEMGTQRDEGFDVTIRSVVVLNRALRVPCVRVAQPPVMTKRSSRA